MEYEDTNILRTQYVDDLVEQRQNLEEALKYQNINTTTGEGLKTLVPKVAAITGNKLYLPYINFYASGDALMTDDDLEAFINTVNINVMDSLKYFLDGQTKITKIDFSNVYLDNQEVAYMFYGLSGVRNIIFSTRNDLSKITDLKGMCELNGGSWAADEDVTPIDFSSFILNEDEPITIQRTFTHAGKLPSNLEKCTIMMGNSIFSKMLMPDFVLDLRKYKFKWQGSQLFRDCCEGSHFKEVILDFALKNVEGIEDVESYSMYNGVGALAIGVKKFTFLNTHLCKAKEITGFIDGRGLEHPINLSGINLSKMTSLNRMITYYPVDYFYMEDVDTSHIKTFSEMFSGTHSTGLRYFIGSLSGESATTVQEIFPYYSLLTHFTGLKDVGKAYTQKTASYSYYTNNYSDNYNLSYDSLILIINKLYDLNITYGVYDEEGNPGTGTLYTQKLVLGSKNLAKLTAEEIAIATNKGWTVS